MLLVAAAGTPQTRSARSPRPAPRWPDGTINLGAPLGESGKWEGQEPLATDPNHYEAIQNRRSRPGRIHIDEVPLQPWARAIVQVRHARFLADEPYTRCKPSPGPRSFGTAYGVEVLNLPGQRPHLPVHDRWNAQLPRSIHMDGRSHPSTLRAELLRPLDRLVGRRHAGHRQRRLQRRRLDGTVRRYRTPTSSTRSSGSHVSTSIRSTTRYSRRSGRVHGTVDERLHQAVGAGHRAVRVRLPGKQLRTAAHDWRRG